VSKIKHIYCNTEIPKKEKKRKKQANVQINETQNTIIKANTYEYIKVPNYG